MKRYVIGLAVLCVLGSAGTSQRPTSAAANTGVGSSAKAQLLDSEGRGVGEAVLRQLPHGVLMSLTLTKIAPGVHALHIHNVRRCERPTFECHFNPTKREHGFLNPRGVHAGDLPNIHIPT